MVQDVVADLRVAPHADQLVALGAHRGEPQALRQRRGAVGLLRQRRCGRHAVAELGSDARCQFRRHAVIGGVLLDRRERGAAHRQARLALLGVLAGIGAQLEAPDEGREREALHHPAMNASPGSGGATWRWNSRPSHAGRYSAKYTQAKRTRIAIMLIASAYVARSQPV